MRHELDNGIEFDGENDNGNGDTMENDDDNNGDNTNKHIEGTHTHQSRHSPSPRYHEPDPCAGDKMLALLYASQTIFPTLKLWSAPDA